MLAALTFVALLVHQTLRKRQQRRSYDRCGSLMSRTLACAGVAPCFACTATSHASSRANPMIRPKIAVDECKASPGAKALLDSCNCDTLVCLRPLATAVAPNVKLAHNCPSDQQTSICGPQTQSRSRCGKFRSGIGCCVRHKQ